MVPAVLPIEVITIDSDSEPEEPEEGEIRELAEAAQPADEALLASSQDERLPVFEQSSSQELAAVAAAAVRASQAEDASEASVQSAVVVARAAVQVADQELGAARERADQAAATAAAAAAHETSCKAALHEAAASRRAALAEVAAAKSALATLTCFAADAHAALEAAGVSVRRVSAAAEQREEALRAAAPTTRLFVNFKGSQAPYGVDDEAVLACFAHLGARCAHVRSRAPPRHAFASVHIAGGPTAVAAAVAAMDGQRLGQHSVTVCVAPAEQQTPCTAPKCLTAAAEAEASAEAHPASKRPRLPPVEELTPPASPACAPGRVLSLVLPGCPPGAAQQLSAGLLQPLPGHPSCAAAAELLLALPEPLKGCQVAEEGYRAAMALAADAASASAPGSRAAQGLACLLRCTPRDSQEAQALAGLPCALSARADEGDSWRLLLQPGALEGAPTPTLGDCPPHAARLLSARLCSIACVRAWTQLLGERRLALALDLDDTVVKAYRVQDLAAQAEQLRAEAEAAREAAQAELKLLLHARPGEGGDARLRRDAAQAQAQARAACASARQHTCASWLAYLHAFATAGCVPALQRYAVPTDPLLGGARYTAYRVPGGLSKGLLGDAALLRISGEAMLVCVRPGWPRLRDCLRARFWSCVATHASLEYAAEVARLLDPALTQLALLSGGGEAEGAQGWRSVALPPAPTPDAAAPPLLAHIASFRRDAPAQQPGEAPPQLQLIQKSFAAFRGVQAAGNAFLALDDLVGGRAAGTGVWGLPDANRVLCPPPFRPFQPREEAVLERCAEGLTAVHAAFFLTPGALGAEQLADAVQSQERLRFLHTEAA